MQLTVHTDYALRVLLYLTQKPAATISELAEYHRISRNHLVKVVHELGLHGFIVTLRGQRGGVRLAREPGLILIGEVVRRMESQLGLVECLREGGENVGCQMRSYCGLRGVLHAATAGFLAELDRHSLADVLPAPLVLSRPRIDSDVRPPRPASRARGKGSAQPLPPP